MTETTRACAVSMAGAAIGALVGYLFFTERGRVLRRQFETTIDTVGPEIARFKSSVSRAAAMASEGWDLLNEVLEGGSRAPRYVEPHQTSPF